MIFKSLFTRTEAEIALKSILAAFTELTVKSVRVNNPSLPIYDIHEKQAVFDILCETDREQVGIEMQASHMAGDNADNQHKNICSRSVFNVSNLHAKQEGRGLEYSSLKRSFQITICNYILFRGEKELCRSFNYRTESGLLLNRDTTIILVEAPKSEELFSKWQASKSIEGFTDKELWAIYLHCAGESKYKQLITQLISTKKEFNVATKVLTEISTNPGMRAHYNSRRMFRQDMEHNKTYWRNEGIAEGEAKGKMIGIAEGEAMGIAEGKIETARNFEKTGNCGRDNRRSDRAFDKKDQPVGLKLENGWQQGIKTR